MGSAISKVELEVGAASSITVNSLKLVVASDADFSNKLDEVSATFAANSTIEFTPTSGTEWATNAYYKFIFNVTVSVSSNKFIEFKSATFYKQSASAIPAVATIGDLDVETLDFGAEGTFNPSITPADGVIASDYTVTWDVVNEPQLTLGVDGKYVAGNTKGSVDVTVHVTPNSTAYEAVKKTFTVKVKDPKAHTGLTQEDAFTVAEAIEAINEGGYGSTEYFVRGIVSSFFKSSITGDGTNYRYYISDDGLTTTQLLVYKGTGLNQTTFAEDDLLVGDEVIVKGTFTVYQNTPEINSGNYLVSWNRPQKAEAELSFEETEFVINLGDDFTAPTLSNPNNLTVVYSSSNEEVAMVDDATGEVVLMGAGGSTTITATFSGNNDYKASSASYTLTVVDPNAKGTLYNPYTVAEVKAMNSQQYPSEAVYVKGFIVGCYANGSFSNFTRTGAIASNLAIADDPSESNKDNTLPVQLGSNQRAGVNVQDNPHNIGVTQVVVNGTITSYMGETGVKSLTGVPAKVAESISVNNSGYATYYTDVALDFTGLENMFAYTAEVSEGKVTFTKVDKVPANTGVLLRNPNESTATNVVPVADSATGTSAFVGTLEDIAALASVDGEYSNFILNNGNSGIGFYPASNKKVAAHKAYLHVETSALAKGLTFIGFDDATGIELMEIENNNAQMFNLAGQRVGNDYKGIVIINGKKVRK